MTQVKIEVSARHLHITQQDLEILFGEGYQLEKFKPLSQPGEFASTAAVALEGAKNRFEKVRIIGPCRPHTQVEISRSDAFYLGIDTPLRLSGKIESSGGAKLIGPKGQIEIDKGVIVAKRHLHLSAEEALTYGVKNGQNVSIKVEGERGLTFDMVEVRAGEKYSEAVHLDTDEANAAGLIGDGEGELII